MILKYAVDHIDGLVQDCSASSVLALELLLLCIKPLIRSNPKSSSEVLWHFNVIHVNLFLLNTAHIYATIVISSWILEFSNNNIQAFLAATKQLYKWYFPSVRLSVCLSVRHTFLTMFPSSYHHEIFWSYYQWQKWRPCKSSRSEVKGQGHRGHNPTLPFPDCNSSLNSRMMMKWCI